MDQLKDTLQVNKLAFNRTIKSLSYLPILTLVVLFGMLVNSLAGLLLGLLASAINLSFVFGILEYLVNVCILSLTMACLNNIMTGSRISFNGIKSSWSMYISPLMNTMFIFWLVELAFEALFKPLYANRSLALVFGLIIQILESPMLESVYIANESGTNALMSILNFLKDNMLQWVFIMLLFAGAQLYVSETIGYLTILQLGIVPIIQMLIFSLIISFIYIYKGQLYKILYNSSIRKRKFMGVFDDSDY